MAIYLITYTFEDADFSGNIEAADFETAIEKLDAIKKTAVVTGRLMGVEDRPRRFGLN